MEETKDDYGRVIYSKEIKIEDDNNNNNKRVRIC
jgi:hypothetical protein